MKSLIKFAFSYAKEEKRLYLPALAITLLTTLMQLPVPFLFKKLIDNAVYEKQINSFVVGSVLILSITLLREFGRFVSNFSLEKALVRIVRKIKVDAFSRFLNHSYYPHEKEGYLVSRIYDEPDDLRELFFDFFILLIRNVSMFLFGIFALLSLSSRLTLIVLALIPFYVYLTIWGRGKLEKLVSPVIEKNAEVRGYLTNILGLTADFKLFDDNRIFIRKTDEEIGDLYGKYLDYIRNAYKYNMLLGILSDLTPVIVVCFGILEVYKGRLTIGGLFAFSSMHSYLLNPVVTLLNLRVALVKVEKVRERLENFYKRGRPLLLTLSKTKPIIKAKDLYLRLGDRVVMNGVNFEVSEGEKVMIIGRNGTGKSTFLKVLSGLMRDFSGNVELFYEPYKEVSALLDTSGLFKGTILENIVFGESYDEKRLHNVVEITGLDKTNICLSSFVDIGGKNLSLGEKQRVLLARALYKDARVYLFDEPLEHIPPSEAKIIYNEMLSFLYNKTVITVMHVTSGFEELHDKIFEMKGHKLIEIESNKRRI